jgi:hypothetical protein
MKHILATAIWVAALAAPAIGRSQMGPGNGSGTPQSISGKHFGLDGFEMYTQGEPFQLVERITTVRTKPDGTKETSESIRHVFRDSQGRFRVELGHMKDGVFQAREITIFDPVALIKVDFGAHATKGRLTHVQPRQLPTAEDDRKAAEQEARSAAYRQAHPDEFSDESLGSRVIAGEEARGMRKKQTFVSADGSRFHMVTETWTSAELKIPVLTILDDSEQSHRVVTTEVTELKRMEPDAALFKVPANLTLEEQ